MTMAPVDLIILGAGSFALDVADLVSDIPQYRVVGFAVNLPPYAPGATLLDLPVYWIDDLAPLAATHQAVGAMVSTRRYQFVQQVEALGFTFATIIHPSARVSRRATVGAGTVINGGVQVANQTRIGRHVVINRGANIGHDNVIQDFATISPGANLAGNVTVGYRAYVGLGANVLEKRTIGDQAIVGAGALVNRDVPPRAKAVGVPARVIEEGIDGL